MFIIGIIVGIIITVIGWVLFATKKANMSLKELGDCGALIIEAGNNRTAMVSVWHDDKLLDVVELEEK